MIEQYPNKCIFSEKTLASSLSIPNIKHDVEALNEFNYKKIYHIGYYDKENEPDIKQYRQAEFCVKDEVDLKNLKYIVTRSYAEKETLLYSLHYHGIYEYDSIIKCYKELNYKYIFYEEKLFINKVNLSDNFITMDIFNYNSSYNIECFIKYDCLNEQEKLALKSDFTCYVDKNKYKNLDE